MAVDPAHPRNAAILRHLRNPYDVIEGPGASLYREARQRDLAAGSIRESAAPDTVDRLRLGTHPDLVERLWRVITISLPARCEWVVYGSPALVHPQSGVIFGWARGTHTYALRLAEPDREVALAAGARTTFRYTNGDTLDVRRIGEDWVLGHWIAAEREWCLGAYRAAGPS